MRIMTSYPLTKRVYVSAGLLHPLHDTGPLQPTLKSQIPGTTMRYSPWIWWIPGMLTSLFLYITWVFLTAFVNSPQIYQSNIMDHNHNNWIKLKLTKDILCIFFCTIIKISNFNRYKWNNVLKCRYHRKYKLK